jgi:hypothetical protein
LEIMNKKLRIKQILAVYRNEKFEYGIRDCNLMMLEIHEPNMFEQLVNRYSTARGGARVANKIFGHRSIQSFIVNNNNYQPKRFDEISFGDVILGQSDVAICIGSHAFGVIDGVFKVAPLENFKKCRIYSKEQ